MLRTHKPATIGVHFESGELIVTLDDGGSVSADIVNTPSLQFLRDAPDPVRANWTIEPHGFAVYWPDLDDGVEVCHLLAEPA